MPGFERNRFIDLTEREAKHFTCNVCHKIFNDPIKSECEHTFCKDCVQKWVRGRNKCCPECNKGFTTRKRLNNTRSDDNLVIVGSHTFKHNLMANNFVNDLKVKCDFVDNGCKEVIEFGLLSAHLKVCAHRLCGTCGVELGDPSQHNCVQLLNNIKNELKNRIETNEKAYKDQKTRSDNKIKELMKKISDLEKCKSDEKVLKEEISSLRAMVNRYEQQSVTNANELKEQKETLQAMVNSFEDERLSYDIQMKQLSENTTNSKDFQIICNLLMRNTKQTLPMILCPDSVIFGKCKARVKKLALTSHTIVCEDITSDYHKIDSIECSTKFTIFINKIIEIKCCIERNFPFIIIRTDAETCASVNQSLKVISADHCCLGQQPNGLYSPLFNQFSNYLFSDQFIIISLMSAIKHNIIDFVNYCKIIEPKIEFEYLSPNQTKELIDRNSLNPIKEERLD